MSINNSPPADTDASQGPSSNSLPRGISVKEASDPTSSYSNTKCSLELPYITSTRRIPAPAPQNAPLPPFVLHCTLFASYDLVAHILYLSVKWDVLLLTHAASPLQANNKVLQSVSKLRKRVGVQIRYHTWAVQASIHKRMSLRTSHISIKEWRRDDDRAIKQHQSVS